MARFPICFTRISKVGKCIAFQLWTPTYFLMVNCKVREVRSNRVEIHAAIVHVFDSLPVEYFQRRIQCLQCWQSSPPTRLLAHRQNPVRRTACAPGWLSGAAHRLRTSKNYAIFSLLYAAIVLHVASTHVLSSLSHNLRSNFRGHLKLNNPNFYRLIVTTDECFIPLNGKHSLLTIVTHFNFKKNFRSCGKQEFPTICPKWRATRRPFCSGAKWPARMAYLDRIYFWWNKNAFNILWGDNGFCKKHWRVSFDYSHTFCDKKK